MSQTLASLRRKLDSARQLQGVVRTMKAMAASSIGQYEAAVTALAGYESNLKQALGACFREQGVQSISPPRSVPTGAGAIVFGSDQGLVGPFNQVLCSYVVANMRKCSGEKTYWAVGERMGSQLTAEGLIPTRVLPVPSSVGTIASLVGTIQRESETHRLENREYSELFVFHNRPLAGSQYEPVSQRLLPLDQGWQLSLKQVAWPGACLPQLLLDQEQTLNSLIREYLFISVYKACAESLASENAARLAAMQRAEKNIDELSSQLRCSFQRLRQSSIDEELFDVLAGFNALN